MPGLGINIDHVATIREARKTIEPDPVRAAAEAEMGGADCITFHLRKDRRHISDRDARLLKETVTAKLNMEMSLDEEIVGIALDLCPDQVTIVPENRAEITTEGGLQCVENAERLRDVAERFRERNVMVSAFIDPDCEQIEAAAGAGCPAIEIHTGSYANALRPPNGTRPEAAAADRCVDAIRAGLSCAKNRGLVVHAGHGLNYHNAATIAALGGFEEFNIGHAVIARAVFTGLRQAVRDMKELLAQCRD